MVSQLRKAPVLRGVKTPRIYPIMIVVVVLVPALILAGYLAVRSARLERAQLEESAQTQAREVASAIERDIGAIQSVLFTLASSNLLETGNLEGFYDQATDVSRRLGVVIVLSDAQNTRQIVNTALPWGASLIEDGTPPLTTADAALLQSGNSIVTNVFLGSLSKRYRVAAVVPVLRDGRLLFYLSAGIPLQRFAGILGSLDVRANEPVGVFDRNGTFVARSATRAPPSGGMMSLAGRWMR
jgi:hypothetical protein